MRYTLIVLVLLLLFGGIAFATYTAYENDQDILEFEDMSCKERIMYTSGSFEGKFRCELKNRSISGYEYVIEDDCLYITVKVTAGGSKALPTDDEGYVSIKIEGLDDVENVYYRDGSDKDRLLETEWR